VEEYEGPWVWDRAFGGACGVFAGLVRRSDRFFFGLGGYVRIKMKERAAKRDESIVEAGERDTSAWVRENIQYHISLDLTSIHSPDGCFVALFLGISSSPNMPQFCERGR
jgi:hypothetical protein